MVKLLGLLAVPTIAVCVVWLVFNKLPDLLQARSQRKLYKHNPEMSDLPRPVIDQLTSQKQQLDRAGALLQAMLYDPMYVILPDDYRNRATAWLKDNNKEISQ